tara:strand:- start:39 stop:1541 length:1503 start_codon:yes stop_codon:yes gene_type:complete
MGAESLLKPLVGAVGKKVSKKAAQKVGGEVTQEALKGFTKQGAKQSLDAAGTRIVHGGANMLPDIAPGLTKNLELINQAQEQFAPIFGKETEHSYRNGIASAINDPEILDIEAAAKIIKADDDESMRWFADAALEKQKTNQMNDTIGSFADEKYKAPDPGPFEKAPDTGRELPYVNKEFADAYEGGASEEELLKILKAGGWEQLNPQYKFIYPEEFLHNQELVETAIARTRKLESGVDAYSGHINKKAELSTKPVGDPAFDRAIELRGKTPEQAREVTLGQADKNVKTSLRDQINDPMSRNVYTRDQSVMGMSRQPLRLEAQMNDAMSIFADKGVEWHHTFFGSKDGGSIFLQKVTQEPMIAYNLMALLKKLDIPTSGTIGNLTLLKKVDHTKLHQIYRELGFEQGKELDFAGYMKAIGDAYLDGTADVNQFFRMIEVYQEEALPIIKAALDSQPNIPMKETGMTEFAAKNVSSKVDKALKVTGKVTPKQRRSTLPKRGK